MRAGLLPFLIVLPFLAFKRAWRSTLVVSASALAVVAPWTLRNAVETHRFVPIATAGWGSNLFQGTLDTPSGNPWPFIMQQRAGDMEGPAEARHRAYSAKPAAVAGRESQAVPQVISRRWRVRRSMADAPVLGRRYRTGDSGGDRLLADAARTADLDLRGVHCSGAATDVDRSAIQSADGPVPVDSGWRASVRRGIDSAAAYFGRGP